jgi:hypothetical protein
MPTDYEKLREENILRYGWDTDPHELLGKIYAERTHFIFELLQNSEDAKANNVRFNLKPKELQLIHDGRIFDMDDVRAVCSFCKSTSHGDSDRIGRFGIGFKSVYCYTATPEIHSGDEHFAIEHYVRPKAAAHRKIAKGQNTLIALPFTSPSVTTEVAFKEIASAFQELNQRALLFLSHVKSLEVKIENQNDIALKRMIIAQPEKWVSIVSLVSDESVSSEERWLVVERSCELKSTADKPLKSRVEIAFALSDGNDTSNLKVKKHDGATLAVFFPTDKPTHTGFILQGPYRTTPARDNILFNDPINEHLVRETCELVVETLYWLRNQDCLTTEVFHTLPLTRADFPEGSLLHPLFEHVLDALTEQHLLPAHTDAPDDSKFICGNQAVATSDPELRELLTNDELKEALGGDTDWRWLAEDMSLDGDGALAVYLRDEIEIQEFTVEDFVSWLETKDADWWKNLDEPCLLSAYRYLHLQPSEHKRLRKLPLVRLESGEHVSPDEQAVFFPADNIHEKKELAPFLGQLPIIRLSLLDDDEDKTVESFLRRIGVARLVASEFIKYYFVPHFKDGSKHTVADVVALGRYLFSAFQRMDGEERQATVAQVSQVNWLLCRTKAKPKANYLSAPSNVYIGSKYKDSPFLDDYFSASPDKYFVDECYHEAMEDWLTFLETLGCASTPRKIEDGHGIDGLAAILAKLSQAEGEECMHLARTIFETLSVTIPEVEYDRRNWGIVTNREWATRRGPGGGDWINRTEPSRFITSLKKTAWLPQISGVLTRPGDLFENTDQNRRVLGDRVCYLHEKIKLASDKQKWLAKELGIQARPTKDSILRALRLLKAAEVNRDEVVPLYNALAQFGADVAGEFEKEELVFCPGSEEKWRPQSEVFWNDESPVFGATRGYLRQVYPDLQSFFLNIGVAPNASPADYAEALLEIAKSRAADEASKNRIYRIYKRLSPRFDEGGDWLEDETWESYWSHLMTGRFWLGRKGDEFGFYSLRELVVVDNEHLENLFHGKVAFWPFKDLNDFAKEHLELDTCSTAEPDFQVEEKGGQQDVLSKQLANVWPSIGDFLQSDKWKGDVLEGRKFVDTPPLIMAAGKIAVIYSLKEAKAKEPDGKAAFFSSEENTIWLVPYEASNGEENFEAVSEALKEHYGPEALREFCHDLFRKGIEKAEVKWRKCGLMVRPDVSPEPEPAEPVPNTNLASFNEIGATVEIKEGETGKPDETTMSSREASASYTHNDPTPRDTRKIEPAPLVEKLNKALNKPEKASVTVYKTEHSPVPNPEHRRILIEDEIRKARQEEPPLKERKEIKSRTVWESKNRDIRIELKHWYAGQCQICSHTFRKRDGENYFEACYLVPRTAEGASWLDRVGNVLCLCADCSAKFQFGSIESASDIQKKIADLKLVKEGGVPPHTVPIRLCGDDVVITFDERHLIDLQSMLKAEHTQNNAVKSKKTSFKLIHENDEFVQCPHCASKILKQNLERHINKVHKAFSTSIMCANLCGNPAAAYSKYCKYCHRKLW